MISSIKDPDNTADGLTLSLHHSTKPAAPSHDGLGAFGGPTGPGARSNSLGVELDHSTEPVWLGSSANNG